jgi:hypothetical protein
MRRPAGSVALVLASIAIAAALTGCGRFGHGAAPAEPTSPAPSISSHADDMDAVLDDLDGADDALTQVDSDAGEGDAASGTHDAP